jgi:hypothetical protein
LSKYSPEYHAALEASKRIHKGKAFTGKFLRPHAAFIGEIIKRLDCRTVLDFGCGKGQQYEWIIPSTGQTIEQLWGVTVTKYDPAYPPFAKEPEGGFDLVICTQVLGAIPVADRPVVVDRLYSHAKKAIYISERLGVARKKVGDNALRGSDWNRVQWFNLLGRPSDLEVTFATRETINGEKITEHWRTMNDSHGEWWKTVEWPHNVRAMNHKWTP